MKHSDHMAHAVSCSNQFARQYQGSIGGCAAVCCPLLIFLPSILFLQGWTTCSSDMLIRPESTDQLASAMKDLRSKAAAQGRPLKMRATRPGFATMHSMPCSAQPSNPNPFLVRGKQPLVVGIMMDKMIKTLGVDHGKKQLRVQAQMTLKDLYAVADANQMSNPRSALPWWQGLTLAGIFSTSSHGTGRNVTSMLVSLNVDRYCSHTEAWLWGVCALKFMPSVWQG